MDQTKIYADTPVPYALETALHRHRDCKCGRAVWMCGDCANGRDVGHSHAECGACATCLAAEELALAEAKL